MDHFQLVQLCGRTSVVRISRQLPRIDASFKMPMYPYRFCKPLSCSFLPSMASSDTIAFRFVLLTLLQSVWLLDARYAEGVRGRRGFEPAIGYLITACLVC